MIHQHRLLCRLLLLLLLLTDCKKKQDVLDTTVPVLNTTTATGINNTTATSGGNISSDGRAPVTTRGVCWSTNVNPNTLLSTKTNDGTGTGSFISNITGLTSNTLYYVRAYATNSAGTGYGNEVSFTTTATAATITTTAIGSITQTTATSGGNISNGGGGLITARGVCWSINPNPDTTLTTKTNNGTGIGSFTSTITGLTPNTTYYVRAYATNSAGTAYGNQLNFKTAASPPTLITNATSDITPTLATSGGIISNDGGSVISTRGVCWSTNPNPDTTLTTKTNNGTGIGSFTSTITGLTPNTTYYVRAYATNSAGTAYGNEQNFTTAIAPAYKLHGLGFSPYMDGQNPNAGTQISEQQIVQLLQKISPYTNWVRTYGTTDGLEKIAINAHNMNLRVAAGAWLDNNMATNQTQISNLISMGLAGQIDLAIVGNEVLLRNDLTKSQLIGYINQVKAALPNIPVTTAENYQFFLANPDLITAVDVLFIHIHPFWDGININCATNHVDNIYTSVQSMSQGKEVVVAETGWPSDGNANIKAIPSPGNAFTFFLRFTSWAKAKQIKYFYFSAFDETWKVEPNMVGPHWGIWNKNGGQLKPEMIRVFNGETAPNNWVLDTAIILADPPSVSFTFVPPLGSLLDLEGVAKGVLPNLFRVAVYIYVNGGWWTKPTFTQPVTSIQCDGSFICDITTGGNDQDATKIRAYVIPASYNPPLLSGATTIPIILEQNAVAWIEVLR